MTLMKFLPGVAKKGMGFHPLAHTVEIVGERSLRFVTLYHCARSADRNRHGQGVKNTEGNQQPETETGQSLGQRKCKGFRAHPGQIAVQSFRDDLYENWR